jgi:hypothetical protein
MRLSRYKLWNKTAPQILWIMASLIPQASHEASSKSTRR